MLKEAQNSNNTVQLSLGIFLLASSAAVFVVLTLAFLFVPLYFLSPSSASAVANTLYAITEWMGLNIGLIQRAVGFVLTLLVRFVLIGGVVAAVIFLFQLPKRLIAWGASEASVVTRFWERGYGRPLQITGVIAVILSALGYTLRNTDRFEFDGLLDVLIATSLLYTAHVLFTALSLTLWRYGSKLIYPVLKSGVDE